MSYKNILDNVKIFAKEHNMFFFGVCAFFIVLGAFSAFGGLEHHWLLGYAPAWYEIATHTALTNVTDSAEKTADFVEWYKTHHIWFGGFGTYIVKFCTEAVVNLLNQLH